MNQMAMNINSFILYLHVAMGFSALIAGCIAIIASKGGEIHMIAGLGD